YWTLLGAGALQVRARRKKCKSHRSAGVLAGWPGAVLGATCGGETPSQPPRRRRSSPCNRDARFAVGVHEEQLVRPYERVPQKRHIRPLALVRLQNEVFALLHIGSQWIRRPHQR